MQSKKWWSLHMDYQSCEKKIEKNGLCPHRQNTEDCVSKQDRIADYSIILVIINILCLHATKQIY